MSGFKLDIYRLAQMPDPKVTPIEERYIALVTSPSGKNWFSSHTLFGLHDQIKKTDIVVIAEWQDIEKRLITEGVFREER